MSAISSCKQKSEAMIRIDKTIDSLQILADEKRKEIRELERQMGIPSDTIYVKVVE